MKIVLSTNGADIINNKGNKIILKGLVRPSLEWNEQGENLSIQDIQNMRGWEANVIRIDLNQNYWFASGPSTQMGSYKQIINAMVYYAIQNNMAVILDLHWTENGHQSNMANKDSIRFWKEVANEYKNFGTVLFELFNEPTNINKNIWLNGNEQYAGYQELYDAVRATGAENICIINGLSWGYDLSFVNDHFKINGYNIVYGSHPYNRISFDQNFQEVLGKYPLVFTEFGVNEGSYFPNGYQTVYKAIIDYANQNQISYTGFAWWADTDSTKVNTFPDLIKDWSGTPLNGGRLIHDDMQASPGTSIS
ncbi:MAG: Endo-beta-1,4-glucanase [uncultured bacterium]|nr:MAG: Endo-beta-1,4-glucanase [uncultured bacterium]